MAIRRGGLQMDRDIKDIDSPNKSSSRACGLGTKVVHGHVMGIGQGCKPTEWRPYSLPVVEGSPT